MSLALPAAGVARAAVALPADAAAGAEATLKVFNRDIVTFRVGVVGSPPADRARRAQARIEEQLAQPGPHQVSLQRIALGTLVLIDGSASFIVTDDDADRLQQQTPEAAAQAAADALGQAIAATRESRSVDNILRAVLVTGAASALLAVLIWGLWRARQAFERWLLRATQAHVERLRVSGVALIRRERLVWLVHGLVVNASRLLALLLLYEWLSLVLAQFPYTRVWGEQLNGRLLDVATGIGRAIVGALPGLFTAGVIFGVARFVNGLLDSFFDRVKTGQLPLSWLEPDVADPTRRIVKVLVWLFALAMAYPYLPGSGTEAFKGLSLLLGLMISIGSSNLVGQLGSGLILTYARVFRRGEYVRIGEHEGTVTELGIFATRIRTGLGEELMLSNSLVLGSVTKNYSRVVKGAGFVLDTRVSIGYDTPWRQVHAMLVDAALRTPGVLADPAPRVFQTALSDFYPEYRLVCQAVPSEPRPRAMVLSALHENIQDLFNQNGVQIMSPHYLADPSEAKVVAPARWHTPPARPPDSAQ